MCVLFVVYSVLYVFCVVVFVRVCVLGVCLC